MSKSKYVVVTDDQAAQFEAAGMKVEVQYVVKVDEKADKEPVAIITEPVQPAKKKRTTGLMRAPTTTALRWTGLRWQGAKVNSQIHIAYNILNDHFAKTASKTMIRRDINVLLASEFVKHGLVFHGTVLNTLLHDRYLEIAHDPAQQTLGL